MRKQKPQEVKTAKIISKHIEVKEDNHFTKNIIFAL